ncbi:MAG: peptidylprolyl isomerase [Candidatus Sumerlaeaceae bacterium]|nr:peptidylprolyl isomerase [Candidatus Sumerlaeaceae bacterium]
MDPKDPIPREPVGVTRVPVNTVLFVVSFLVCLALAWVFVGSGGRAPAPSPRSGVSRPSTPVPIVATPVRAPALSPTAAATVDADVEPDHEDAAASGPTAVASPAIAVVPPWSPPAADLPVASPSTGDVGLPPPAAVTPLPATAAVPTHSILPATPTPTPSTGAPSLSPKDIARLINQYGADYVMQGHHLSPNPSPTVPPIALPPGMRLPGSSATPTPSAQRGRSPAPAIRRTPLPIISNMTPDDPTAPSPARGTPIVGLSTESGEFDFPTDAGSRARLGPRLFPDPGARTPTGLNPTLQPDPASEPPSDLPPPPTPPPAVSPQPRVMVPVATPETTPDALAAATGTPPPSARSPLPVSEPAPPPTSASAPDAALLAATASPPPQRQEHVIKRGGAEVKFSNVAPGWLRKADEPSTGSRVSGALTGASTDDADVPSLSGKKPAELVAALAGKLPGAASPAAAGGGLPAPNPEALPPEVARRLGDSPGTWGAAVGDRVLTPANLKKRADAMVAMGQGGGASSNRELLEQRIAEDWAERVAVAEEARRNGIVVNAEDMEKYRQLLRERNGPAFERALRQAGFTDAEIEQDVRDLALAEKFVDSIFAKRFDEEKVRKVYDAAPDQYVPSRRLRVSEIFKARPSDPAAARQVAAEMERLRREAASGADFGALASRHSEGDSRQNNGDLGWIDASSRVSPEMAEALAELQPGGVSRVVQTKDGFTIYKLVAVEEPRPGFEGAKPLVLAAIREGIRLTAYDEAKKHMTVRIGGEVQKPRSVEAAERRLAKRKTESARRNSRQSASARPPRPAAGSDSGTRPISPEEFQRPVQQPTPTPEPERRGWFRRR